jgi:molybdopterin-synthase adenylyltransferase
MDRFIRQRDVLPPDKLAKLAISVIGCGAVGSFTVLTLAKMGITDITVYDGDKVEEHNLPNQWYKLDHLGMNKTDALLCWFSGNWTVSPSLPRSR